MERLPSVVQGCVLMIGPCTSTCLSLYVARRERISDYPLFPFSETTKTKCENPPPRFSPCARRHLPC